MESFIIAVPRPESFVFKAFSAFHVRSFETDSPDGESETKFWPRRGRSVAPYHPLGQRFDQDLDWSLETIPEIAQLGGPGGALVNKHAVLLVPAQ